MGHSRNTEYLVTFSYQDIDEQPESKQSIRIHSLAIRHQDAQNIWKVDFLDSGA